MANNTTDLTRYMVRGMFVGEILPSKVDKFGNELNSLLIKYCGEHYFIDAKVDSIDPEVYKDKTEEINEKENDGLVTCPYTSEWCDKLKDRDPKSLLLAD